MTPEEWRRLSVEERNRFRADKHRRRQAEREANRLAREQEEARRLAENPETPVEAARRRSWKEVKSGVLFNRDLRPLDIASLYKDATCFVVSCGPSLAKLDLSLLAKTRGVLTCGINNSPTVYRPNLWVFGDPPYKFHDSIWCDPAILKFVPLSFMSSKPLRRKNPDGSFSWMESRTGGQVFPQDMPGVIGYRRSGRLDAETFLTEDSVSFGRNEEWAAREKTWHVNNTFFSVIKILYAVGVRHVYLLGCDFSMRLEQPYVFGQSKGISGVRSNNRAYSRMNQWFTGARSEFEARGLVIENCSPESSLTAFDYVDYRVALSRVVCAQDPLDASGWYSLE